MLSTFVDGLRWNLAYRVCVIGVNLGAMLLLVRVIPPAAYGQVAVVTGLAAVLNVFCVPGFLRQALQVHDVAEPNWSQHFSAGFYIQLAVSTAGHAIAGLCWMSETHRAVAPLLHVVAIGILLDWPNQLGAMKYLRELNFRRLQLLNITALFARQGTTVTLALLGMGAYAIVIGSLAATLPFTIDLLLLRKWRPSPGWWRWPDWYAYRPALRFGFENIGSGLLQTGSAAVASMILPGTLGYTAIGLWGRAQSVFTITLGQGQTMISEIAYPILPRYAHEREQFARAATYLVRIVLLVMVPGTVFLMAQSIDISRVLYGDKWAGADALLWPGILVGFGAAVFQVSTLMFLALNRLRTCLLLSVVWAASGSLSLIVPLMGGEAVAYAWAMAALQLAAGAAALIYAGHRLENRWATKILAAPAVSTVVATIALSALRVGVGDWPRIARLAVAGVLYGGVYVAMLRTVFPETLSQVIEKIPGGNKLSHWLGMQPVQAEAVAPAKLVG